MKIFAGFNAIVCLTLAAFSQAKVIDEAGYMKVLRQASEAIYSKPYRVRQTTEHCKAENCIWRPLYRNINEIVPGGGMRSSFIDTQRGESEPSSVWIIIGEKRYVNRRNSGWRLEPQVKKAEAANQATDVLSVEYRDLGRTQMGDRTFAVIQKLTKARLTLNGTVSDNSQTITSWIDNEGRLFKQEFLSTNSANGSTPDRNALRIGREYRGRRAEGAAG